MKKILALLMAAILLCGTAFASDSLQLDGIRYITVVDTGDEDDDSDDEVSVYAFAKVINTGDEAVRVKDGYLMVAEGSDAEDTDTFSAYAEYLQPGEYTYVRFKLDLDNVTTAEAVTDTLMTIDEGETKDHVTTYYQAEGSYDDSDETMYARVTNDSNETAYGIKVCFALKDAGGNLLYVDSCSLLSKVGLETGSTVVMKCEVPELIDDYFNDNGLKPAQVETIAYLIKKIDSEDDNSGAENTEDQN